MNNPEIHRPERPGKTQAQDCQEARAEHSTAQQPTHRATHLSNHPPGHGHLPSHSSSHTSIHSFNNNTNGAPTTSNLLHLVFQILWRTRSTPLSNYSPRQPPVHLPTHSSTCLLTIHCPPTHHPVIQLVTHPNHFLLSTNSVPQCVPVGGDIIMKTQSPSQEAHTLNHGRQRCRNHEPG